MIQFSIENEFQGGQYRIDVCKGSFENLNRELVSQVYGLILNEKSEVLIVYHTMGYWLLPSGVIEKGESFLDTLNRELHEEAAIYLYQDSIQEAFYQEIYKLVENNKWQLEAIQLRYLALLKSADIFKNDPDGDILKIKWIAAPELGKYIEWGKTVLFIQTLMSEFIQSNKVI